MSHCWKSHVIAQILLLSFHQQSVDRVQYDDYPILRYIQDNVIGHNIVMDGPFGPKRGEYQSALLKQKVYCTL